MELVETSEGDPAHKRRPPTARALGRPARILACVLWMALAASTHARDTTSFVNFTATTATGTAAANAPSATLESVRKDRLAAHVAVGQLDQHAVRNAGQHGLWLTHPQGTRLDLAPDEIRTVEHANGMLGIHAHDGSASFIIDGDDIVGSFTVDGRTWKLTPLGDGQTAMYRYNTRWLRRHPPGWTGEWPGARERATQEQRSAPGIGPQSAGSTGEPVIDVLAVYTSAARAGSGNIRATLQLGIDNTNTAWRNSDIRGRASLADSRHVSFTEPFDPWEDTLELLSMRRGEDFDGIHDTAGTLDEVHAMRDEAGADLVVLVIDSLESFHETCGIGWTPDFGQAPNIDWAPSGFSVVDVDCIGSGMETMAHEFGHNQGALHDPDNNTTPQQQNSFPDRFGRCNTRDGWHTVMAYPSNRHGSCRRASGRFSSPDVRFEGSPTGDTARRNNARVLNATLATVAAYRSKQAPAGNQLIVPLAYAGDGVAEETILRLSNGGSEPANALLTARDDRGDACDAFEVTIPAGEVEAVRSPRLHAECPSLNGRARHVAIHAPEGVGATVLIRSAGGFMTTMNATVPAEDGGTMTAEVFNPGSNREKVSYLRLVNLEDGSAQVTVRGTDDQGRPGTGSARITLPAQGARTVSARDLEEGTGEVEGGLGDGTGKWRLDISSPRRIAAVSFLRMNTGSGIFLSNLSLPLQLAGAGNAAPPEPPEPPEPPPPPADTPDLAVSDFEMENWSFNDHIELDASVSNQGTSPSPSTQLRFYRSNDGTVNRNDTRVGARTVNPLDPGRSEWSFLNEVDVPRPTAPGTYYFGACVDPVPGDTNSANDCAGGDSYTVERPDLAVERVSVYEYLRSWSATVRNRGGPAPGTLLKITQNGRTVQTKSVRALEGGSFSSAYLSGSLTGVTTGILRFCVDTVPHETATGNNCTSKAFTARAPSAVRLDHKRPQ